MRVVSPVPWFRRSQKSFDGCQLSERLTMSRQKVSNAFADFEASFCPSERTSMAVLLHLPIVVSMSRQASRRFSELHADSGRDLYLASARVE